MKHAIRHAVPLLGALLLLGLSAPGAVWAQEDEAQAAVELVVATGIQDREPVGASRSFPADVGQVYAWIRVTGMDGRAVQVIWRHGEDTVTVPLEIGGTPWRTWSAKTIPPEWTGPWSVSVEDADGNVLASADFTVG